MKKLLLLLPILALTFQMFAAAQPVSAEVGPVLAPMPGSPSPNPPPSGSPAPPSVQGNGFGKLATCNGNPGIQTPLGCIASTPIGITNAILKIVMGIAGGIAILLIIIGGFKIGFSHGNPDALEDGRSMITAAIIGLVFLLLATVILGIIGVDILDLKFFNFGNGGSVFVNIG